MSRRAFTPVIGAASSASYTPSGLARAGGRRDIYVAVGFGEPFETEPVGGHGLTTDEEG